MPFINVAENVTHMLIYYNWFYVNSFVVYEHQYTQPNKNGCKLLSAKTPRIILNSFSSSATDLLLTH